MTLDDFLDIGVTRTLGSHTFQADEIKAFAAKYDPQPFHLDEAAAERSVFGRLCASGWHTAAMWMRHNLLSIERDKRPWTGEGPEPVFGPSPGFQNLKWLKPVYAGETVTYTRVNVSHRAMASRPGWRILSMTAAGYDSTGDKVLEFDSAVLVQTG
ncbi:MaoC family dehydratase [Arvimicrobium flavum]|uniref:MaoC family dehydratase n=1 Tax=Arvimicrobium flavum TaxID=3393320 RepID=UPI00237B5182|nr:MaoC family dehydratase [Mesorhizobium shangrilense]